METKITTLHPQGKQGVNIDSAKYAMVKDAILKTLEDTVEVVFTDLAPAVGAHLTQFDGSIGW